MISLTNDHQGKFKAILDASSEHLRRKICETDVVNNGARICREYTFSARKVRYCWHLDFWRFHCNFSFFRFRMVNVIILFSRGIVQHFYFGSENWTTMNLLMLGQKINEWGNVDCWAREWREHGGEVGWSGGWVWKEVIHRSVSSSRIPLTSSMS